MNRFDIGRFEQLVNLREYREFGEEYRRVGERLTVEDIREGKE